MCRIRNKAISPNREHTKSITRSKNMFALGIVYWMYNREMSHTLNFFEQKFKYKPEIAEANAKVLKAGFYYAETLELIQGDLEQLTEKFWGKSFSGRR